MKNGILLFIILSLNWGCKKPYQKCESCPCFNIDSIKYGNTMIDSATFYQALLGKWYAKQKDSFMPNQCMAHCYCDTQYYVTFLANDSVIVNIPGSSKDTFQYAFYGSNGKIDPTSGCYFLAGPNSSFCDIVYSGNYLALSPPNRFTRGTMDYSPNCFLSRH